MSNIKKITVNGNEFTIDTDADVLAGEWCFELYNRNRNSNAIDATIYTDENGIWYLLQLNMNYTNLDLSFSKRKNGTVYKVIL